MVRVIVHAAADDADELERTRQRAAAFTGLELDHSPGVLNHGGAADPALAPSRAALPSPDPVTAIDAPPVPHQAVALELHDSGAVLTENLEPVGGRADHLLHHGEHLAWRR